MATRKDLEFEIVKHHGVIAEKTKGWKKEVNSVSWSGAEPKYDIRDWAPEHDKMGKGITLTEAELRNLYEILKGIFAENHNTEDFLKKMESWNID